MRIRRIERNSTLAWAPARQDVMLALGTVAGALDASFSSQTELELFDLAPVPREPLALRRLAAVTVNARFNRLAWGSPGTAATPRGLIAGGKENGELDLWNPQLILDGKTQESLLLRQAAHGGPIRGLDFNPLQGNLLATGATDAEISIWDMNNLGKSYSPGARSQRLEDITSLSWNRQVPHILATASNNGYTVVWDLRNRKEIVKLAYPGGRKPITAIAWHPDMAMEMITAADDDQNPMLLMWNLRFASAPSRTFAGHSRGILSAAWCPKDSDLLLSTGKDNRTIVWNTVTGEAMGDLNHSTNWTFDAQWSPKNPDLSAVASFDGRIVIHSLQSVSGEEGTAPLSPAAHDPVPDDDPFAHVARQQLDEASEPMFVLRQPPKWLRRPAGATFAHGGKLVHVNAALGPSVVSIRHVPADAELSQRIDLLDAALRSQSFEELAHYCDTLASTPSYALTDRDREVFRLIRTMFSPSSRQDIVQFLGFDKNQIADDRLAGLLKRLNVKPLLPGEEAQRADADAALNGEGAAAAPKPAAASAPTPFSLYAIGKTTEDSDIDTLVTKALILGDFETAVNVCLGANRLADALALSTSSGDEQLIYRTQQEFFKRTSKYKPYSRILQGIADGDLTDVVENARLDPTSHTWRDLLAFVCTYAKDEDFSRLFGVLAQRLESGASAAPTVNGPSLGSLGSLGSIGSLAASKTSLLTLPADRERTHASVLCHLLAGNIERVVDIWTRAEQDDIRAIGLLPGRRPNAKVDAQLVLQTLVEKVSISRIAAQFSDPELAGLPEGKESFTLAKLYARYIDYAANAMHQGRPESAWRILEQVPEAFTTATPLPAPAVPPKPSEPTADGADEFEAIAAVADSSAAEAPLDPVAVLRDLVFQSGGYRASQTGLAPAFPFPHFELVDPYQVQAAAQAAASQAAWGQQQQQHQQYQQPQPQYETAQYGHQQAHPYQQPAQAASHSFVQQHPFQQPAQQPAMYGQPSQMQQPPPPVSQYRQPSTWDSQGGYSNGGFHTGAAAAPAAPPTAAYAYDNSSSSNFGAQPAGVPGYGQAFSRSASVPPVNSFTPQVPPPQAPRTPAIPESPVAKKHPAGDRTHIIPAHQPCFTALQKHLDAYKAAASSPNQHQTFRDVEKRINQLFDQLNNQDIPQDVVDKLALICKGLDTSDFSMAHNVQMDLMTKRFEVTGQWIVGVKRLIDAIQRIKQHGMLSPPAPAPAAPSMPQQPAGGPGVAPPPLGGQRQSFHGGMPSQMPPPPPTQPLAPPPLGAMPGAQRSSFPPQPPAPVGPPPTSMGGYASAPPPRAPSAGMSPRMPAGAPPVGPPPVGRPSVGPPPAGPPPVGPPPTQFQQPPPPTQFQQPPPPTQFQQPPPPTQAYGAPNAFARPPSASGYGPGQPVGPPPVGYGAQARPGYGVPPTSGAYGPPR
ncbi:protein transport protein S31 [Polyrhizophydium stewartii]|uniref:Protein transport protein SEC31 n=1 Tax=Polyrhizophydium stewartii TaxID=2732419 RepID=A0ABR4NKZ6_9FUNG